MADSDSSSSPRPVYDTFNLPSNYTFLTVLGEGGFGTVLKCWEKDTQQTVAVKIPKSSECLNKEISVLKKLKRLNLDQHNIVKFFCCFNTSHGRALVFEVLDISMYDYMWKTNCAPMCLSDVSTIIQQLAKALEALKGIGVIHTDLTPDNIMLVDHRTRPFRVKLIDFGVAIPTSKAKRGKTLQNRFFRAPEIILGLPFSEAIDMWSLGVLMAAFAYGQFLFPGGTEYEVLQYIVKILGQPADHLLNNGLRTRHYFIRTESSWRLKTREEYYGGSTARTPYSLMCYSLDDLKQLRLEPRNEAEAVERAQCVDLLKAMLTLDETERISPTEVLTHPFIASSSKTASASIHPDHLHPALSPQVLPSGVILVQPAAPENTLQMDDEESAVSPKNRTKKSKTASASIHPDHLHPALSPQVLPSGVILVQPAAPENTLQMEDEESAVSPKNCTGKSKTASASIHPDHLHPALSPQVLPSGVILVQPAAPENTLQMEDEESAVSLQAEPQKKSSVNVTDSNMTSLKDDTSTQKKKKKKKKKNCVQRFFSWMRKTFCSCCTINKDIEGNE